MIYQLHSKRRMRVKSKILNSQQQKSALLVKEMALNLVILLIDVQFVVEMVKLDLIKVFLLFSKHVLSAKELVKKLPTHVLTVMVKVINRLQKKYQLQSLKVLMMEQEYD